jgi:hypothetical protein
MLAAIITANDTSQSKAGVVHSVSSVMAHSNDLYFVRFNGGYTLMGEREGQMREMALTVR